MNLLNSRRRWLLTAAFASLAACAGAQASVPGPDAARVRAIAEEGPDVFYTGWIADRIAEGLAANAGHMTREDLAKYRARQREPVRGNYGDYEIISMPPPSSGGIVLSMNTRPSPPASPTLVIRPSNRLAI